MSTPSDDKSSETVRIQRRRPPPGERSRGAVDALQTKIAVNIQNLDQDQFEDQLRENIAELPDATGCDAAFLALFSNDLSSIDTVLSSNSVFSACNPDALTGESLDDWPWLGKRLGHLRVIEITNTDAGPKEAAAEMARLAELNMGSALVIGFTVRDEVAGFLALASERPVDKWDVNLHLLMKLIGASLASGLERMRTIDLLEEMEERNALVNMTANDGIWDFDGQSKRIRLSRRWKAMLGYPEDQDDVLPDWYRLVHPDDMARVQAKMREHLEGKTEFFESVHRMKHQNGGTTRAA
jgi:PAS domain S-box-containing protein